MVSLLDLVVVSGHENLCQIVVIGVDDQVKFYAWADRRYPAQLGALVCLVARAARSDGLAVVLSDEVKPYLWPRAAA